MMPVPNAALVPAKAWLGRMICAIVLAGGLAPAAAQEFSADIVMMRDNTPAPAGHLRVLDGKVRVETPELPNAFFLVDVAKPSAYFVRPATRIYMDAVQSSRLTQLFVPLDLHEPCGRWRAMAQLAGAAGQAEWSCERTGEEEIAGRKAAVYRVASAGKPQFLAWLDRDRGFPLRIKTADGTVIALENIHDEPQPASSFVLPSGFQKFSPEALVERIKQSDVWVGEQDDSGSPQR